MGFLDQLVKLDIAKQLKKLNIHILNNVRIGPLVKIDKRTVIINSAKAAPQDIPQIAQFVNEQIHKENRLLVEDKAEHILVDFGKVDEKQENKDLLGYFRGKIPDSDLPILRASIYLKTVHDRRGETHPIKEDISIRYGRRGNVIANLCTAGYFETVIKPLYRELASHNDFTREKFLNAYEGIIGDYVFAVFVNIFTSYEKLKAEVLRKIELNIKYGIHKMNLHAIGRENKEKILNLLKDEDIKKLLTHPLDADIVASKNYITVSIEF
jgi:hypothetical protein